MNKSAAAFIAIACFKFCYASSDESLKLGTDSMFPVARDKEYLEFSLDPRDILSGYLVEVDLSSRCWTCWLSDSDHVHFIYTRSSGSWVPPIREHGDHGCNYLSCCRPGLCRVEQAGHSLLGLELRQLEVRGKK